MTSGESQSPTPAPRLRSRREGQSPSPVPKRRHCRLGEGSGGGSGLRLERHGLRPRRRQPDLRSAVGAHLEHVRGRVQSRHGVHERRALVRAIVPARRQKVGARGPRRLRDQRRAATGTPHDPQRPVPYPVARLGGAQQGHAQAQRSGLRRRLDRRVHRLEGGLATWRELVGRVAASNPRHHF